MSFLTDLWYSIRGRRRPPPVPPPPPPPNGGQPRLSLFGAINEERVRAHIPQLRINGKLSQAAQEWADHLRQVGQEYHGDYQGRIRAAGYDWSRCAENIAQGQRTAEEALAAWLASASHRANLLSPELEDIGIGQAGAFWVTDFGTQRQP